MMTIEQPPRISSDDASAIQALTSITPEQADVITQTVHALRPDWEVQTNVDYDGYLSLLIGSSIDNDEQAIIFIAGTEQRLELFQAQGDDMTAVGTFADLKLLLATLQDHIRHQ